MILITLYLNLSNRQWVSWYLLLLGQLHTHIRTLTYLLFGKARVYDKHDSIDGQRSLSDIGRHHHLPADGPVRFLGRGWLEDPLLEVGGEGGVEGDAFQVSHLLPQVVHLPRYPLARLVYFLGEEDGSVRENVFSSRSLSFRINLASQDMWTVSN